MRQKVKEENEKNQSPLQDGNTADTLNVSNFENSTANKIRTNKRASVTFCLDIEETINPSPDDSSAKENITEVSTTTGVGTLSSSSTLQDDSVWKTNELLACNKEILEVNSNVSDKKPKEDVRILKINQPVPLMNESYFITKSAASETNLQSKPQLVSELNIPQYDETPDKIGRKIGRRPGKNKLFKRRKSSSQQSSSGSQESDGQPAAMATNLVVEPAHSNVTAFIGDNIDILDGNDNDNLSHKEGIEWMQIPICTVEDVDCKDKTRETVCLSTFRNIDSRTSKGQETKDAVKSGDFMEKNTDEIEDKQNVWQDSDDIDMVPGTQVLSSLKRKRGRPPSRRRSQQLQHSLSPSGETTKNSQMQTVNVCGKESVVRDTKIGNTHENKKVRMAECSVKKDVKPNGQHGHSEIIEDSELTMPLDVAMIEDPDVTNTQPTTVLSEEPSIPSTTVISGSEEPSIPSTTVISGSEEPSIPSTTVISGSEGPICDNKEPNMQSTTVSGCKGPSNLKNIDKDITTADTEKTDKVSLSIKREQKIVGTIACTINSQNLNCILSVPDIHDQNLNISNTEDILNSNIDVQELDLLKEPCLSRNQSEQPEYSEFSETTTYTESSVVQDSEEMIPQTLQPPKSVSRRRKRKGRKSEGDTLDWSYLDEDSGDMYSHIKTRRSRKNRRSCSPGMHSETAFSDSSQSMLNASFPCIHSLSSTDSVNLVVSPHLPPGNEVLTLSQKQSENNNEFQNNTKVQEKKEKQEDVHSHTMTNNSVLSNELLYLGNVQPSGKRKRGRPKKVKNKPQTGHTSSMDTISTDVENSEPAENMESTQSILIKSIKLPLIAPALVETEHFSLPDNEYGRLKLTKLKSIVVRVEPKPDSQLQSDQEHTETKIEHSPEVSDSKSKTLDKTEKNKTVSASQVISDSENILEMCQENKESNITDEEKSKDLHSETCIFKENVCTCETVITDEIETLAIVEAGETKENIINGENILNNKQNQSIRDVHAIVDECFLEGTSNESLLHKQHTIQASSCFFFNKIYFNSIWI